MLLPLSLLASFQLSAVQAPVYNGREGQLRVAPPRVESAAITIDGRLDEPVWNTAAVLTGFSLYQPVDGRPAPDSTEVRVWYSASAIHFGIRAYEPHGSTTYSVAERDRLTSDDQVEIHLDTFDERNRALVFIVNPLGIQADGTKSEGGGFIPGGNVMPGQNDLSADYVWQSKGNVTEWGFEVEIRIPFSSLRYPVSATQQWGIQIDRRVMHSGYEQTWTPTRRASASFIGQAGWLTDLQGMSHGHVFELNPEVTNTINGAACCAPTQREWGYASRPRLGGNLRWTVGSNFVLNGTVRPDFSQVEADATQIAADQRFALFYAERRPFFVESLDQFNVPNTLVYTRTIVQPAGAAKLFGKVGRADVAVLSALDDGSRTSTGERPLVNIVRLRRGFGEQSFAGLVYSERTSGVRDNRVVGADSRFVFGKYYAQFQAVAGASQDRVSVPNPGGNGANFVERWNAGPLWEAVVDRTGRNWGFHYNLIGISPEFRADNGFVPRTGYVQPNISNRVTWYGKQGALLEQINGFTTLNAIWRYDDFFSAKSLLENYMSASVSFRLRGGWSVGMSPKFASYAFDPAQYTQITGFTPSPRTTALTSGFTLSTPQFQKFSGSMGATVGNDVDFQETSRIQRLDYNATLNFRPSSRLRVTATYQSSEFTRRSNDEQIAFTKIPRLKLEYQVARPLFVRVVSQYTATKREPLRDPRTGQVLLLTTSSGTVPSARSASNGLRTDWLFSYRPTPGTVAFVGYGGSLSEQEPLAFETLRRTSDAFFVKFSYAFRARL
jgi:hypothetical protein